MELPADSTTSSNFCAVCGDRHHGHHFGILACRACSSFWRRSLLENRVYKCRSNNNCEIGKFGMKNSCRSCRLKRCRQAGMREQIPSVSIIIQEPTESIQKTEKVEPLSLTNELSRYQTSYRNFCSAQKSLFIAEHPTSFFSTPEFKPSTKAEHKRMERSSLALVNTMLTECSETYRALSNEAKSSVIKSFCFQFGYLNTCYISSNYYPELGDPKMCAYYGYYVSKETLPYFFKDTPDIDESITFCNPLMDKSLKSIDKFRKVRLREIEFAALIAISLHNTISTLDISTPESDAIFDTINTELLYDVINYYGIANSGVRIGQIHSLLNRVSIRAIEMKEMTIMAHIFLTNFVDEFLVDLCR